MSNTKTLVCELILVKTDRFPETIVGVLNESEINNFSKLPENPLKENPSSTNIMLQDRPYPPIPKYFIKHIIVYQIDYENSKLYENSEGKYGVIAF